MKYESHTSNGSKVIANVKVFRYVSQRSGSRSQSQNIWYEQKGHITRNVHVKYKSPTSNGSKVMANFDIFRFMYVVQRTRSKVARSKILY